MEFVICSSRAIRYRIKNLSEISEIITEHKKNEAHISHCKGTAHNLYLIKAKRKKITLSTRNKKRT